jgi:hypothetical protein
MPDDGAKEPEVPLDPEAKALKLEQIKAEARKSILDAQLATAKALVPTIDTSGLKETVTLDEKAGSIVNAVAASQLSDAAKSIVGVVKNNVAAGSRVILVEGRSIAEADVAYATSPNGSGGSRSSSRRSPATCRKPCRRSARSCCRWRLCSSPQARLRASSRQPWD